MLTKRQFQEANLKELKHDYQRFAESMRQAGKKVLHFKHMWTISISLM